LWTRNQAVKNPKNYGRNLHIANIYIKNMVSFSKKLYEFFEIDWKLSEIICDWFWFCLLLEMII
jgi:hypothetical protein